MAAPTTFLHHADFAATIGLLDRLMAGRAGYRVVPTGREIDWDQARSRLSSTQQATLDAVRALYRLEVGGSAAPDWWQPFTEYVTSLGTR
jgi:hypothetical protein